MKVHDVSLVMRAGMPTWPGEDGPRMTPLRRIAKGDSANVSIVTFGNHTGTHVDPPVHFIEGAASVEHLPLNALVGPCRGCQRSMRKTLAGAPSPPSNLIAPHASS